MAPCRSSKELGIASQEALQHHQPVCACHSFLLCPEASLTWSGYPSSAPLLSGLLTGFDSGPSCTLAGHVGAWHLGKLRKRQLFIIFFPGSILVCARGHTRTRVRSRKSQSKSGGMGGHPCRMLLTARSRVSESRLDML